jgi:hypothetical protein
MRGNWAWVLGALLAVGAASWAQEGYVLEGRRVLVEGAEQWGVWQGPLGVHVIEPDGAVRPRFLRADINAVTDAGQFRRIEAGGDTLFGGISAAGSNIETAANIIDGDERTFWEPDPEDGIDNWFVEIDLGRATVAQRIVVRFAEGGDPFLKFRVMVSDGRKTFGQARLRQFFRIGQVTHRNKDQREFTFDVEPLRPVREGVVGEVIQFVRIDAIDSDGPRGREVEPGEYERLAAADQGVIDYFRVTIADREIPVLPETYALLPAAEQGPVRHYRRERPQLAEVEVIALGDNVVALTQRALFEDQTFFSNFLRRQLTDGLHSSSFDLKVYDPLRDTNQLDIDLGAKYWIDKIRLVSPRDPPVAYQVRISDGSLDPAGGLVWTSFDERLNPDAFLQLEEAFPVREVRHIELRRLDLVGSTAEKATLSEVQAYGEGYVSEVELTSPLIRLGRARIFSTIEWEGQAPPGTRLEVRTRSGDDLLTITHYYDRYGRVISEDRWVNIRNQDHRGPVVVEEFPGPRWSNWSEVYAESGELFKSPSPRQMALVQVRLLSRDPLRAAQLRSLVLNFSPPLVDQALAEIWPVRGLDLGEDHEFTLYWRPSFGPADPGFDRVVLRSSASAPLELVSVHRGSDLALRLGAATRLWPGDLELSQPEPSALELAFPAVVRSGSEVYAMTFRTRIFLNSTTFSIGLANSLRPGVEQAASEGDVGELSASQSLVVVADLRRAPLLDEPEVVPRIVTPNGDGVNDEAELRFAVFRLEGQGDFDIGVFDLAGRRVRDLSIAPIRASGEHRIGWDGRDDGGVLLPPGIYLMRVGFDTDAGAAPPFSTPVYLVY